MRPHGPARPPAPWTKTPANSLHPFATGKIQIFWTIAGIEHASESINPEGHYTKGGTPGDIKFLKKFYWGLGANKLTPAELAEKRVSELKNGRMAMLGMASICSAMAFPGSVPFLENAPALTGSALALPFGGVYGF